MEIICGWYYTGKLNIAGCGVNNGDRDDFETDTDEDDATSMMLISI